MNIAFRDTYRAPGSRGGLGRYTIQLGRALSRLDPRHVDIFTSEPGAYPECRTICDDSVFFCSGPRRAVKLLGKKIVPDRLDGRFDGVLYPHPFEPVLKAGRAKSIMVIHDVIPLLFPRRNFKAAWYYFFYRYYLPRVLAKVDIIVAISENTRRDLVRSYRVSESRLKVIYPGLNENYGRFSSHEPDDRFPADQAFGRYFLYVGNSEPHKNIPRLLAAFSHIRKIADVHLVLVGTEEGGVLGKIARRLEIGPAVHFLTNLSDAQLRRCIQNAQALIQPSLYEGFGLPPLEAMALSAPVICSSAASLPEVCGSAGIYFDPWDVASMAAGMARALTDEPFRRDCIEKGRRQAEKFVWDSAARQFMEILSSS